MQLPAAQRQATSLRISSYSLLYYTDDTQRHPSSQVGVGSSRVVMYDATELRRKGYRTGEIKRASLIFRQFLGSICRDTAFSTLY